MKPFTGIAVLALGWLAAGAMPAQAAWNNVFQTCCHDCGSTRSAFFAPAPAACPTICYRQRCCYEPVVTYKMQTYMEPVTTYRTSYFWEPVTTYKYTSYYDPCTGCCQRVCTPCTSYRLRSQCNAVCSYVQRCCMVPVTTYRQSCYLEPVVTYSAPACPPDPCPPGPAATPGLPSPGVTETPGVPGRMPQITEDKDRLPPQNLSRPRTPPVRIDRTTSAPSNAGRFEGMVVRDDRITPRGNAKVLFVSMEKQGPQQSVTTDASGRFDVSLPAGDWLIYTPGADGKPEYHSQLTVRERDARTLVVVRR